MCCACFLLCVVVHLLVLQADSGYDAALYSALSVAPVLLLDGRPKGTSEHAGFAQLAAAGEAVCCCCAALWTNKMTQSSWAAALVKLHLLVSVVQP
jgi:hypothetical protein